MVCEGVCEESGRSVVFCPHSRYNVNFSTFGFMDRLHGTDLHYMNSIACKRHVTLTGVASARELYPEGEREGEGEGEGEKHEQ